MDGSILIAPWWDLKFHVNTNTSNLEIDIILAKNPARHCDHQLCTYFALLKILVFATKIQLHVTHATTNLCNCLRQVAHDIKLHVTLGMQNVYTMLIYMFIHTYQFKCSYTLCAILFTTIM